jgi:hypothetical protein
MRQNVRPALPASVLIRHNASPLREALELPKSTFSAARAQAALLVAQLLVCSEHVNNLPVSRFQEAFDGAFDLIPLWMRLYSFLTTSNICYLGIC